MKKKGKGKPAVEFLPTFTGKVEVAPLPVFFDKPEATLVLAGRVYLGLDELHALGISYTRSGLYKMSKRGAFPKPAKLSGAINDKLKYPAAEVFAWMKAREEERV
jgi:predicted DNA-binding transcriptional regulator AlpA